MKVFQWASALGAAAMFASVLTAAALGPAATSGAQSNYNGAVYQVEFSLNCTNPAAPCASKFGLGGIWGWVALMPDGTANAQFTGCGHIGGVGGGAVHISFDSTWTPKFGVAPSSLPPGTPTTDPHANYLAIAPTPNAHLPWFPATYGHYATSFLGANGQITIAP